MQSVKIALYLWDTFQGLFLGLVLIYFRRNGANRLLGFAFLMGAVSIGLQYLFRFKNYLYIMPGLAFVADTVRFALPPTYFFYVYYILLKRLPTRWWLYYVPALAFASYGIFQLSWYDPYQISHYALSPVRTLTLFGISGLFLLCLVRLHLLNWNTSFADNTLRMWAYTLFFLLVVKAIPALHLNFLHVLLGSYGGPDVKFSHEILFVFLETATIFVVQLVLIRSPVILAYPDVLSASTFPGLTEPERPSEEPTNTGVNQVQSIDNEEDIARKKIHISTEDALPHLEKLRYLIDCEKIYLNPDINEKFLATAVGIQPYLLSKLLNDHVGESFNEFLNRNRIEEAKRMLLDSKTKKYTIFAIALECGYNSESVFYTNFKKYTGMTPKKYQDEISKPKVA